MCYHKKFQLNWLTEIGVTANLLTSLFDVLEGEGGKCRGYLVCVDIGALQRKKKLFFLFQGGRDKKMH